MGLEYCPNGELYQQMQERGPLPLPDVVQYAAEIVDILAYLRYVMGMGLRSCATQPAGSPCELSAVEVPALTKA